MKHLIMVRIGTFLGLLLALIPAFRAAPVVAAGLPAYDMGSPTLRDVWVDPGSGNDAFDGSAPERAFRTLAGAWRALPTGPLAGTGYRIRLQPGTYPGAYLEARQGAAQFPILIEPANGPDTVTLTDTLTIYGSAYIYLQNLHISVSDGDAFHCDRCDHVLLRHMTVSGRRGSGHTETVKANQSTFLYIEASDLSGAGDNALDMVAVHGGHVVGNRLTAADGWCAYAKGDSSDLLIDANEIADCGNGGFTAGEGTGTQWLVPPWVHYEAAHLQISNNVIHDTYGACLGVQGGFDVLVAYNTCYRVGQRSHGLEVVQGYRGCDGGDVTACQPNVAVGGWGTLGAEQQFVPNRNVFVYNNLLVNPPDYVSRWQHLWVRGPATPPADSNLAGVTRADDNLQIRGNVLWNGPADLPLGIEDASAGCQPDNPTCNATQLRADNRINTVQPQLVDPAHGDFHLAQPLAGMAMAIPSFPSGDAPTQPAEPAGELSTVVTHDHDGQPRGSGDPPGAYAGTAAAPAGTATPTGTAAPTSTAAPTGTAVPTTTPTVAPPVSAETLPVVPQIDATLQRRLRTILDAGAAQGNRQGVFAKVGDELTVSPGFLKDIGCNGETLGAYADLAPVIDFFRATALPGADGDNGFWCGRANAYTRVSLAAGEGWTAARALDPTALSTRPAGCEDAGITPLACELRQVRPAVVLVLYGTNDLVAAPDPSAFQEQLSRIVTAALSEQVIPVLATVPPRVDDPAYADRIAAYNQAVLAVGAAQQVPVMNLWRALHDAGMINQGLNADGSSLSTYQGDDAANFTAAALQYGNNRRNLVTIQTLEKLVRIVFNNGTPDGA